MLLEEIGYRVGLPERAQYERARAASRAALGESAFAGTRETGRMLSPEQAMTEALATVVELTRAID